MTQPNHVIAAARHQAANQEMTMNVAREMPRFQSHKKVWALKIAVIIPKPNPDPTGNSAASSYGAAILPADTSYDSFEVTAEYVNKHQPHAGGYYVVYEDGYKSFSPAAAFESGYTPASDAPATLNTGQPAIKGYRNLSADEVALMNEIKAAGEQLRDLVNRVQIHINNQPAPAVPHSQVTNPGRWASIGQTDLQQGLMALTRAVAQPTSF